MMGKKEALKLFYLFFLTVSQTIIRPKYTILNRKSTIKLLVFSEKD